MLNHTVSPIRFGHLKEPADHYYFRLGGPVEVMGPDETVVFHGPDFHVDLAPLDALHPVHYSRRLLIFRCQSSGQCDAQLSAFKAGLQALVQRCPILGGVISPLPENEAIAGKEDWRTIVPGKGIELTVRDLRQQMPSFDKLEADNFPPSQLPYDLLVPVPQDVGNDHPFEACKVQFNAIDGGTIISWAMSHSVADGSGTNELLSVLSEETRLAQKPSNADTKLSVITGMGIDRSILRNIVSEVPFDIAQHPGYKLKATPASSHPFTATEEEIPVLLHISPAGLMRLKSDASTPGAAPISTHDALSALVWRTSLLIRSRRSAAAQALVSSTVGSLFLPSDARRHLKIPTSYIGNVVYQLKVSLDLETLFSPSGLQAAATALRAAILAVNPSLVASYVAKTRETWVDWAFIESYLTTGIPMGTDWTSVSMYEDDWGEAFGRIVRNRYPNEPSNCIMPKLPDGSAEVMVSVMPGEVDFLQGEEGFGKYLAS